MPLFAGLTHDEQLKVAQRARSVHRASGEAIHRPGEDLSQLLVVHSGRVRITHVTPSGQERLVRVLEPGDFIGEASFVTGSRPDSWATALADVQLCSFNHADLQGLVEQYPDIAVRMLRTVTARLEIAEQLIADLTTSAVATRLARYLVELPTVRREGQVVAHLPIAKKDIASLLGMSAETLSRQLAVFSEAGFIAVQGRDVVVLDGVALERETNEGAATPTGRRSRTGSPR